MHRYLFTPITINGVEIKNRIAYPAMGLLYSYDKKLNDRYLNYFREKAKGGAGIVTVGPVAVDKLGGSGFALSLDNDEAIPSFRELTDNIKKEGARAWIQLFHAGAYSYSQLVYGEKPLAPSAVYSPYTKETPREMTIEEIHETQKNFTRAALRAREAGFDGVEIIASAGYLITQFLSPLRNMRTDQYGGSFENRTRFACEAIENTRAALGNDYPLTIRMAGNDFVEGSNTDVETPEFAKLYQQAGVDMINVTGGWHESRVPQLPMEVPRGAYGYLALNIKNAVSVPVMASNRISTPQEAEQILVDGMADMVNLGRVLLADPFWPQKAKEGRDREIRPCMACNQGCTDTIFSGQPVTCVVNPRAGYEGERVVEKADTAKNVMVIGAGPAGMEAAVTAAQMGHRVSLYEKSSDIGGQLWMAGAPPHKQEIWELIRYYRAMIEKYSIDLHLDTTMTGDMIKKVAPDYVIASEGAEPLLPPIDGVDDPSVMNSWKVLGENPYMGNNVAVIGGGSVGLETALFIAKKGTLTPEVLHFLFQYQAEPVERLRELMFRGSVKVTVFEMQKKVANDVGKSTRWVLMNNLKQYGVNLVTGARVNKIEDGSVYYQRDGKFLEEKYDTVVVAAGSRPVQDIATILKGSGIPHVVTGDSVQPGKINDAVHGGFLAALNI